ncbi:MAG: nucleotide exchange factor GrpE [Candidatus Dormibacteria bacterium]
MDHTPGGDTAPPTEPGLTPPPLEPEAPDGLVNEAAGEDAATIRALLEERQSQYVRLAADFDNFRRRKAQELADRVRYSSEDAARALLPALDNLRRAVDHAPEGTDDAFLSGVRMTVRQFEEALATLGVTPIDAVGAPFDPSLHEAVAGVESPEVENDTVVDELQRGYRLHDRVIRPSMVRVAHPAAPKSSR